MTLQYGFLCVCVCVCVMIPIVQGLNWEKAELVNFFLIMLNVIVQICDLTYLYRIINCLILFYSVPDIITQQPIITKRETESKILHCCKFV
jgi:hypothetical protein